MQIPNPARIETDVPIEALYELAIREGNHKKPVYTMHKWWARRLGSIFRMLLILATSEPDTPDNCLWDRFYSYNSLDELTVLDPFMGGGTSITESIKMGAKAIGVDIDPVAWFVTKAEIEESDLSLIPEALNRLDCSVGHLIRSFYKTKDAKGEDRDVIYVFWVNVVTCPNCGMEIELHPYYILSREKKPNYKTVFCKFCHAIHNVSYEVTSFQCNSCGQITDILNRPISRGYFTCPSCKEKRHITDMLIPGRPLPKQLFTLEYVAADGSRQFKAADENDKALYAAAQAELAKQHDDLPFPCTKIPVDGRHDHRPVSHGYEFYYQLFNDRQLLSLALLLREIRKLKPSSLRSLMTLAFSDALASNNMFCSYAFDYHKLTPLFGLHAYNIVNRPVENNVWGTTAYGRGTFTRCVRKVVRGKQFCEAPFESCYLKRKSEKVITGERIRAMVTSAPGEWHKGKANALLLNRSATNLAELESASVDLILTDPPYFSNLSYSELSDFYYVWLQLAMGENNDMWRRATTPYMDPNFLFVSKNSNIHTEENYVTRLSLAFRECARVLKPDGLMIFTFHHRDHKAWAALAQALNAGDLVVTNVFPVRSEGQSGFHSTEGTIKWDAVIICRIGEKIDKLPQYIDIERIVDEKIALWQARLSAANLRFKWIDKLSLAYALTLRSLSSHRIDESVATSIFDALSKHLHSSNVRKS